MFGGFPFDRYLFIVHALPVGIGRPRAPRVGDDGHRGPVVRGRGRLPALRRSGGARVLPRLEREADPATPRSPASTTRARTTRACSGCSRASPTTWRTSSCCARASRASATSTGCSPRTGRSTRRARAATRRRSTSCRSRPGSSNTSRPRTSSTARSATTRSGLWAGMALDLELRLATGGSARPARDVPPAVGAFRTARTPDRRGRRARRGRGDRRAGGSIASSTAPSAAPTSCRCRRCWRRAGLTVNGARRVGRERPAAGRTRSTCARAARGPGPASTCIPSGCWSATSSPIRPPGAPGITFGDDIVAVDGARVNAGDVRPARRRQQAGRARRDRVLPARSAARGDADARREPGAHLDGGRRRAREGPRARAVRAGWLGRRA